MLTVDVLHEVELGVAKAVFTHLVRMLESVGTDRIHLLNERYDKIDPPRSD
jgi:hypothetical protein